MKVLVERCDSFLHKLIRIKIHHIHGFRTDALPESLELRHGELIRVNLQLHVLVTGVLRLHGAAVIDGIENLNHSISAIGNFFGNLNCTVCFVRVILISQRTTLDISIRNQILEDCLSCIAVHDLLVASGIHNDLALEQIGGNSHRASGNCIGKFSLQALCKAVIALTGDDSKNIDGLHIVSKHVGIHALTVLIDAQAQPATDLLPFANLAAALFQCANLEHVWVVPAFTQRRVRENETHRGLFRITIQKQFLVLHNQVIGVNIVRRTLLLIGELAVGHLALFVHGEVTGVGIVGRNCVQIPNVVLVADLPLRGAENVIILFLEHIRIDAVERMPSLIILLVLRNLVDKEQGQDFDALMEKLPFPLQVRKNRLTDLDAAKLVFADLADDVTGKDFDAV